MVEREYLPRLIDAEIKKQMRAMGCIVIEGPKWCGKTRTGKQYAKTIVKLQIEEVLKKYKVFLTTDSSKLFIGERPILFDEWQKLLPLWDCIRNEIDETGERGAFILTGSAKPLARASEDEPARHSGTGRITKVLMRPFSLWESQESTGEVSLEKLFKGEQNISCQAKIKLDDIAFLICRGGWPETINDEKSVALTLSANYYKSLTESDIVEVDPVNRSKETAKKILQSYARNVASTATNKTIKDDVAGNDNTLDEKTLASYTNAFRRLFVIEDLNAWSPKLRSATTIRTSDKRHFVDPSVAAAALGAGPDDLFNDINTFGLLFENLCIRDLRIYAESLGGNVYHYRDADGLECDAIIHFEKGEWAAVEIKLGGDEIDEAAEKLKAFQKKVDTVKMKSPKFLMILTGLDYGYRRPDGVLVVPIGCLKN